MRLSGQEVRALPRPGDFGRTYANVAFPGDPPGQNPRRRSAAAQGESEGTLTRLAQPGRGTGAALDEVQPAREADDDPRVTTADQPGPRRHRLAGDGQLGYRGGHPRDDLQRFPTGREDTMVRLVAITRSQSVTVRTADTPVPAGTPELGERPERGEATTVR